MALRDEWKETGKGLGKAFKGLGESIVRSAKAGADKIDPDNDDDTTVFSDGTWRKTGKDLGGAFLGLGRSIMHSAETGLEKVDEAVDAGKKPDDVIEGTAEPVEEEKPEE